MTSTVASNDSTQQSYLAAMLDLPSNQTDLLIEALLPKAHINAFWSQNTRTDGRLFTQARPTSVVSSILKHASGSALVKMGSTKIMVATTIEIGQPSPALPDHGDVQVQVHKNGSRHDDANSSINHNYLQAWLQRQLSELLPPDLNLLTGRAAVRLVFTVLILQDDGNLLDAGLLGCMAAWKDTFLPVIGVDMEEQDGKLWWKDDPATLAVLSTTDNIKTDDRPQQKERTEFRLSLTIGIIQLDDDAKNTKRFLVDPTKREMELVSGSITISVHVPSRLTQIEFTSPIPLDAADFALISKMADGRANELIELLS